MYKVKFIAPCTVSVHPPLSLVKYLDHFGKNNLHMIDTPNIPHINNTLPKNHLLHMIETLGGGLWDKDVHGESFRRLVRPDWVDCVSGEAYSS